MKGKKYEYPVCGWLAPSGDFVECGHEEHRYIASTLFGCDEKTLEEKGYIKITFSIFNRQRKVIACKRPTQAQQGFLDLNEFNEDVDDIWIGGGCVMKDEEMAEEYATKECCATCKCINHSCKEKCECWIFAKKGFLAGLKAGRTQWHDLREDPNDLPNNRRNVWITYINGYDQRETTEASFRYKYWVISGHRTECDVIAWCEIPTFDKE